MTADAGTAGISAPATPTGSRVLAIGIAAWLAAMAVLWPLGASFGDDVGYLGEARLVLEGRFRPVEREPGIWQPGAVGPVAKYPLFPSLLFAPLMAVSPRAVFAVGIAAAVAVCLIAARVLRSWGASPAWALIILAHPTVVIISRTATADLPLCAFMLGAWWALRRDHFRAAVVLFGALFAIKPTGFIIAGALAMGELWRRLPGIRGGDATARRAVVSTAMGMMLGGLLVVGANWLTTGGPWFGYNHEFLGVPPFWFSHFPRTAPAQLRTVLLFPPLLIAGALPFWRRREYAPLAVIAGFGGLMCFYFFVDTTPNWIETWVLGPRLLLPVVVLLLVGYAHLLAGFARRFRNGELVSVTVIAAAAVAIARMVNHRHQGWQRPAGAAVVAAKHITDRYGVRELAALPQAVRAAMMYPGTVRVANPGELNDSIVLCSDHSASHRMRDREGPYSCAFPGYRSEYREGGFEVLVASHLRP